ncbi:MAG TPA: nucleotide exchange factor GrpE [Patescibacteria group bacterium]|nr:nucleotide exchange factor GrpE [Patescibacteria group bacterium]
MVKKADDQVEEVKEENSELKNLENQLKRTLADYQNLEKRVAEDRTRWIKSSNRELLLNLLPVLDTLFLAQKHLKDEGLDLSVKQFLDVLQREGVERIQTEGKDFDPKTMEGIETVEGEEGKVIDETRPGFILHNEVLRPAQVKVGGKLTN